MKNFLQGLLCIALAAGIGFAAAAQVVPV